MHRPDRIPVLDALHVVPHAIAVDHARTRAFGDSEHATVDVRGHAAQHVPRRVAEARGPIPAHQLMIAADTPGRHDDRLRAIFELAGDLARTWATALDRIVGQHSAAYAGHGTVFDKKLVEARLQQLATTDLDITLQNRAAAARLAWNPRLNNPQLTYWLHRIDVPTLFIWGKEDQICPFACAEPYMRPIKNAELYALAETGHALHTERPKEVAAKLNAFFERVKS